MGKAGKISGTISLILGVLFLIGWFGAGIGVDYIDNQLEENCDSTVDKLDKSPAGMRDSVRMEEIHGTFCLHYNIHCY